MPAPVPPEAGPAGAIGVVAIGRNEGARLDRCLAALGREGFRAVYVDSGSTDDSLAIAARHGAEVVHLDTTAGFTAARARNAGLARLPEGAGAPEFVQFLDGDCEVVPGWIAAAAARLGAEPGLAAVAGRRRERFPAASPFNRLCDMEWNTPPGPALAVGGDAMYRVAAIRAAGGFDPGLICGEEPELCLRLLRAGWVIERIDRDMTLHDAAMTRWGQWWRRTLRAGWAFAEGAARYGAGPERYNVRERRRILLWGLGVPGLTGVVALLTLVVALAGGGAWPGLLLLAALIGLYPAMALKVARARRNSHGDPWAHALLYGGLVMLGKLPEAAGLLRYHRTRARGGVARIIEYKTGG